MAIYMPALCGTGSQEWAFWDSSYTWFTPNPILPECFQLTVLQWIPSAFLLIGSIFTYSSLRKVEVHRRGMLSRFNIIKNIICALIGIIGILDLSKLISDQVNGRDSLPVLYLHAVLTILTMALVCFMTIHVYTKGMHTSGLLWYFWFIDFMCQVPIVVSQATAISQRTHDDYRAMISLLTAAFVTLQLVLYSFSDVSALDHSNKYSKMNGERAPLLSSIESTESAAETSSFPPSPELKASYPSRLTFTWITSMLILAYRRALTFQDIWNILPKHSSKVIVAKLGGHWKMQMKEIVAGIRALRQRRDTVKSDGYLLLEEIRSEEASLKKPKSPSLLRSMLRLFGVMYAYTGVLKLAVDLLAFTQPPLLNAFIGFVENPTDYSWHGYVIGVALFLTSLLRTVVTQHYQDGCYVVGMNIRTMTIGQIYRKAIQLSGTSRKETTVGEIVNHMSVDAQSLQEAPAYLHMMWTTPITIIIALVFLWQELGPSSLAGLGLMILLIPINGVIATKIKKYQMAQLKLKDQRIKIMTEILGGIKVLKLYAWESSFKEKISNIRQEEVRILRKSAYLNAFTAVTWFCAPFLTALVTFAIFVLTGNVLTAQRAFVSMSLFNMINVALTSLPMVVAYTVQFMVSLKRINSYLYSSEIDPTMVEENSMAEDALKISNGNFSWTKDGANVLHDVNVAIPEGKLYAVVGNVGSGKSSLISTILGEVVKKSGRIIVKGSIGYVAQQAWCQNCSLQDNILFGKRLRKQRYEKVIEACALKPDLQILDAGDQTEIGEKGINLSGGQKQRVSLARAVYQDADIYLLDDPLSAVDAHVGKHLFEKVISNEGMLAHKTRVLVTHGVTYLPQTDCIIVMKDGRISEMGTYHELLTRNGPFAEFLKTYLEKDAEDEESEEDTEEVANFKNELRRTISVLSGDESEPSDPGEGSNRSRGPGEGSNRSRGRGEGSNRSRSSRSSVRRRKGSVVSDSGITKQPMKKLMTEEIAETGNVSPSVFAAYAKATKIYVLVIAILSYMAYLAVQINTSIWLSVWTEDPRVANDTALRDYYLAGYAGLGFGQAVFVLLQNFILAYGSYCASLTLHKDLLDNVMEMPMSFFDTTPIGRVVNRFGKDINTVDIYIPLFLRIWFMMVAAVLSTLILITIASPIFLVAIVPLSVCYFFAQRFYICSSRQLKRIDSIKRSPIYSHFHETLVGISTVRAFKRQDDFIDKSDRLVDENQMVWYCSIMANRWMGIMLESIGACIILLAAIFATAARGTIDPGLAAVSITNSLNITATLNYSVRMTSDLETYIVAVERVKEYMELPTEGARETFRQLDQQWPNEGRVQFRNYSVRYRPGLDLVLKDLSAEVRPGEMVGIVGRTGAGKSSLTLGLFRILEPASGTIKIDDMDITTIGLDDLRRRLTIIPQDPVLFSGKLRTNLDPFDMHTDGEVWTALQQSHLKEFVSGLPDGLDHQCSEGGENLSVGQRQLVCLARALLRRTKVLILDEATAAVDLETDDVIQNTIRSEFHGCTIITIAHRLNTILDYDRIMVLDKGALVEFDAPSELLKRSNSIFYSMCQNAGLV